jgi:hypothetical protein
MKSGPRLPKSLGKSWLSLNDPLSFPMTFLTIDVERSFLRFLELGVRYGHATKAMKETMVEDYEQLFLDQLSMDSRISGLERGLRKRVLDGWLRATALKFESRGMNRRGGRRLAIPRPLHLGVIRSGLPSRYPYLIHYTDVWTYYTALRALEIAGVDNPRRFLGELLRTRLGSGMTLDYNQFASDEPRYDELTPIDINALIALRILSTFTSARPGDPIVSDGESWPSNPWVNSRRFNAKLPRGNADIPVFGTDKGLNQIQHLVIAPEAFSEIGADLVRLLCCYGDLEGTELTQHCLALLSFRLYQAPLIAAQRVRQIARSSTEDSQNDRDGNAVQIYCDFSDSTDVASTQLARKCVARDLEAHRVFLRDRFYLRILDWLAGLQMGQIQEQIATARSISVARYFEVLVRLCGTDSFGMAARLKIQEFESAVGPDEETSESNARWRELLAEWRSNGIDDVSQLTQILLGAYSPGGRAPAQAEQWCWTTGGMLDTLPHRSFALLAGSVKHRNTWRYAPTDQLLTALLLGCFVSGKPGTASTLTEMRFTELLEVMEARYGIVIDRPPRDFDDVDSIQAAERNRAHFAKKLQLLGCFDGLSDDSQYQMVRRPR